MPNLGIPRQIPISQKLLCQASSDWEQKMHEPAECFWEHLYTSVNIFIHLSTYDTTRTIKNKIDSQIAWFPLEQGSISSRHSFPTSVETPGACCKRHYTVDTKISGVAQWTTGTMTVYDMVLLCCICFQKRQHHPANMCLMEVQEFRAAKEANPSSLAHPSAIVLGSSQIAHGYVVHKVLGFGWGLSPRKTLEPSAIRRPMFVQTQ